MVLLQHVAVCFNPARVQRFKIMNLCSLMSDTAEYQIYHSDSHTSGYQDIVQIGFDNTSYNIHTAESMFYVIVTTE